MKLSFLSFSSNLKYNSLPVKCKKDNDTDFLSKELEFKNQSSAGIAFKRKTIGPPFADIWKDSVLRERLIILMKRNSFFWAEKQGNNFIALIDETVSHSFCSEKSLMDYLHGAWIKYFEKDPAVKKSFKNHYEMRAGGIVKQMAEDLKTVDISHKNLLLDVGSGTGGVTREIKNRFNFENAVGIDVFDAPNTTDVRLYKYDGKKFPKEINGVDLATSIASLHHSQDPDAILHSMNYVTKPDANIYIYEFNNKKGTESMIVHKFFDALHYNIFDNYGEPVPCNYKGIDEWLSVFQKARFNIVNLSKQECRILKPFAVVLNKR